VGIGIQQNAFKELAPTASFGNSSDASGNWIAMLQRRAELRDVWRMISASCV
jgi:hypothetical protein